MSSLDSVFDFLFEYCTNQGSACPLVLVFLLCRLKSIAAQSVFVSTQRKVSLFSTRLDVSGLQSLLHQFPALSQVKKNPLLLSHHSAHMLSVMQGLYDEKRFRLDVDTHFVPFQISNIWTIQQDFYRKQNMAAWDTVPFQISSNTYVAQQYAAEVERIIRDSYTCDPQQGDDTDTVQAENKSYCFVEIGAGHGILSFLLAKELLERQLKGLVICTDFHDNVFVQLLQLPWVQAVCASGYLDFAVCGAAAAVASSSSSSSKGSKIVLSAGLQLLYAGE